MSPAKAICISRSSVEMDGFDSLPLKNAASASCSISLGSLPTASDSIMPVIFSIARFHVAILPDWFVAIIPTGSEVMSKVVNACISFSVFCETLYPCITESENQPASPTKSMARERMKICTLRRPRVWSYSVMSKPTTMKKGLLRLLSPDALLIMGGPMFRLFLSMKKFRRPECFMFIERREWLSTKGFKRRVVLKRRFFLLSVTIE